MIFVLIYFGWVSGGAARVRSGQAQANQACAVT